MRASLPPGSSASLVVRLAGTDTMYLALAYSGFVLNMFNLMPISPLDGGGSPPCSACASGWPACRSWSG